MLVDGGYGCIGVEELRVKSALLQFHRLGPTGPKVPAGS